MANKKIKTVRPDAKGRITLGSLAKGVSSFAIRQDRNHYIILEPYVEIPAHEQWLHENKAALKQVQQGIKDSLEGRIKSRGSFGHYLNDEID